MEITIIEAMRLKKEISEEIGKLTYTRRGVSYGTNTEDGVRVDDQSQPTILEHMERSNKLLAMSFEINNVLDTFNKENGISHMVREMKNNELLLNMYDIALNNSVSREVSRREKFDNNHVTVITKFEPYLKKTEIRKIQKNMRKNNRSLQGKIDKMNALTISLEFSHDEFEALTVSSDY